MYKLIKKYIVSIDQVRVGVEIKLIYEPPRPLTFPENELKVDARKYLAGDAIIKCYNDRLKMIFLYIFPNPMTR